MKKKLFTTKGEGGVALIAVVLTVALVLGLFVMVLTNGMIDSVVTENYTKAGAVSQCGQKALAITNQILINTARGQLLALPNGVKINDELGSSKLQPGDENGALNNFFEEIRGNTALAIDSPIVGDANYSPNIIITDAGCITDVDIDFLFHEEIDGEAITYLSGYHTKTGGTGCGEGDFYYITAVTRTTSGVSTNMSSAFFKCKS